jgi:EAL domain-containing protein (putative c-di-GMP-specific phosphodiesterase class I)
MTHPVANTAHRFLGFAFACADLLIEVGQDDKITFAIGAAATLAGTIEVALVGHSWRTFVDERDHALIEALFQGLDGAARQGPLLARMATVDPTEHRAFTISACRLPQNGGVISCALARAHAPPEPADGGLLDRMAFEAVTKRLIEGAQGGGPQLELAFIEMAGLASKSRSLPSQTAKLLQAKLEGALRAQSHGGQTAAAVGLDRFALVRASGEPAEALIARLSKLLNLVAETGNLNIAARAMALDGDFTPAKVVRAIRHALDDFVRSGMEAVGPLNLSDALDASIRQTLAKAKDLGSMVTERRFKLVFQPVVLIKTGDLHHHEALVRFGDDASPFTTIRSAEELDLIESLDLAIIEQAIAELKGAPKLKLAVNVSGRSITSEDFMNRLHGLIERSAPLHGRLMFEITESAAIDDLTLARQHIESLRAQECMVCLDDFGAGAASLAYLQQLRVDVVKIDGRFIRGLHHGGRDADFIRHLVNLCGELKVKTVAEMVESADAEEAVRRAGVDFAQGWLYGAPADTPEPPLGRKPGPVAARRIGVVESWG